MLASKVEAIRCINERLLYEFFHIKRGDTKSLKNECILYLKELRKIITNIPLNKESFYILFEDEFNSYHSEIMTSQQKVASDILTEIQKSFNLAEKVNKFFSSDLILLEQINIFTTTIILENELTTLKLFELFKETIQDFIQYYNPAAEEYIQILIERIMKDFSGYDEMLHDSVRKRLYSYLFELTHKVKTQKISLSIANTFEASNINELLWIPVFETDYYKEDMLMKQILDLDKNRILISISFEESNKLLLLNNNNFEVTQTLNFFKDKDTIIAIGSIPESIILFQNTRKIC